MLVDREGLAGSVLDGVGGRVLVSQSAGLQAERFLDSSVVGRIHMDDRALVAKAAQGAGHGLVGRGSSDRLCNRSRNRSCNRLAHLSLQRGLLVGRQRIERGLLRGGRLLAGQHRRLPAGDGRRSRGLLLDIGRRGQDVRQLVRVLERIPMPELRELLVRLLLGMRALARQHVADVLRRVVVHDLGVRRYHHAILAGVGRDHDGLRHGGFQQLRFNSRGRGLYEQ